MRHVYLTSALLGLSLICSQALAESLCLSLPEGRAALLSESYEPYFTLLQPREIAAKLGHAVNNTPLGAQRELAKREYAAAVQACTHEEEQALEHYVAIIRRTTQAQYPALAADPWHFIKVADSLEGGLPHTRGDAIVISASLLQALQASDAVQQWRMDLIGILIHEHVHVLQRHMAPAFATVYTKEWGFEKVNAVKGSDAWFVSHQIVNPDGVDVNWVWRVPGSERVIWPRVILDGNAAVPVMPHDFAVVGIELNRKADGYHTVADSSNTPLYADLHSEAQFMKKFGAVSSLYHPNEIAADMLTDLAIFDCLIDKSRAPAEAVASAETTLRPTRTWASHILGPKPN